MKPQFLVLTVAGAALMTTGMAAASTLLRNDNRAVLRVVDSDGSLSSAKRDEYMRKADREYREWQDRMGHWAAKAKDKSADAGDDAKRHLDQAWSDVKDNWNMLQAAAPASWDKARKAYESASQRLKSAWDTVGRES